MITLQRRGIVDTYNGYSFSRPSMAFDSRGRMALPGNARFETVAGRRGVWIEESTTNLLSGDASSFENSNSNGWLFTLGLRANPTFPSGQGFHGHVGVLVPPAANGDIRFAVTPSLNVTAGQVLTISGHVKVVSGSANPSLFIMGSHSPGTTATFSVSNVERKFIRDGWWRISATYTITGSGVLRAAFLVNNAQAADDSHILFDAAQVEGKQYATSWHLGGSTRSPETLTIPTAGVLDPREGTVEFFVTPLLPSSVVATSLGFHDFAWNAGSAGFIVRRGNSPNQIQFISLRSGGAQYLDHSRSWNAGDRLGIVVRWSATGMECFVNGVKVGTLPLFDPPSASTAGLGCRLDTGVQGNAIYGPLRISRRARTDQEIAAAYQAGYLEADADTMLLLPLDGPDAQRAAKAVVI